MSVFGLGYVGSVTAGCLASLYDDVDAPVIRTSLRTAEMVKYAANAFHALKVAFTNEIGTLAKRQRIGSREVMDILCQERVLNLSEKYLRPGFAFGGSCLPKDVRALVRQSQADGR